MINSSLPYGRAARQPLALLVLIVAIITGLTVALWLLPLGLLACIVMVFLSAHDPNLRTQTQRVPRPRLTSPTFRAQLDAIERTQQDINRSIAQTSGPLSRILMPIDQQARELVEQAYVLGEKGQIIERYLPTVDLRGLQNQLSSIDARLAATQDPYTKQQLQETRQVLVEPQGHARDLATYTDRIVAQLQNIAANLDNVLAETIRLRTADVVSTDSTTNQVAQRLSDLKNDMEAFQRVLDTALSQTGAA